MYLIRFTVIVLLGLLFGGGWLYAVDEIDKDSFRRVISIKERDAIIKEGERNINLQDEIPYYDFSDYPTPFKFEGGPEPVIQKVDPGIEDEVESLSDKEVLERIKKTVKPSGYIIRGDVKVLIFGENTVEEGESFVANVNFRPYIIFVESIDRSGYVLRLNNETVKQKLGDVFSSGTIRRMDGETQSEQYTNPYIRKGILPESTEENSTLQVESSVNETDLSPNNPKE